MLFIHTVAKAPKENKTTFCIQEFKSFELLQ